MDIRFLQKQPLGRSPEGGVISRVGWFSTRQANFNFILCGNGGN